jgi:hypothetical protein
MFIRSGMDSKSDRRDWKTDLENNIREWSLHLRTIGFSLGAYPGCVSWVRILGARTSGPHVFTFHGGHSAKAAPGPALTAVSARHFTSKRLCAPGACGHPGCADLRSACLYFSPWPLRSSTRPGADSSLCAPFYFKAAVAPGTCGPEVRAPSPCTQPLHYEASCGCSGFLSLGARGNFTILPAHSFAISATGM